MNETTTAKPTLADATKATYLIRGTAEQIVVTDDQDNVIEFARKSGGGKYAYVDILTCVPTYGENVGRRIFYTVCRKATTRRIAHLAYPGVALHRSLTVIR